MDLNDEDSAAISELVDDSSKAMDMQSFLSNICFQQQQKYRQLKDKRRMHWQPLIIRFALSIKYSSTSAYLVLSKLFVLPSLRDCTHWIKYPCSGTNINAIQFLIKDITQEGFDPLGFKVAVLVDEMKINVNDDIRS